MGMIILRWFKQNYEIGIVFADSTQSILWAKIGWPWVRIKCLSGGAGLHVHVDNKNLLINWPMTCSGHDVPGLTKPGEVGDFCALVSMKSPNFCQKAKL